MCRVAHSALVVFSVPIVVTVILWAAFQLMGWQGWFAYSVLCLTALGLARAADFIWDSAVGERAKYHARQMEEIKREFERRCEKEGHKMMKEGNYCSVCGYREY